MPKSNVCTRGRQCVRFTQTNLTDLDNTTDNTQSQPSETRLLVCRVGFWCSTSLKQTLAPMNYQTSPPLTFCFTSPRKGPTTTPLTLYFRHSVLSFVQSPTRRKEGSRRRSGGKLYFQGTKRGGVMTACILEEQIMHWRVRTGFFLKCCLSGGRKDEIS